MAVPIVEELKSLAKDGTVPYDAFLQEVVLVFAPVL